MRAWSIFLFLLLFGLVSASLDSMQFYSAHPIGFSDDEVQIQEIHDLQDITSEESMVSYSAKTMVSGAFLIGEALVTSVSIIPLFYKYGVPWDIIVICQALQTVILMMGIISFITGRSTKSID